MILYYNGYVIEGTVEEIDQFIRNNAPTSVSGGVDKYNVTEPTLLYKNIMNKEDLKMTNKEELEVIELCCEECLSLPQNQSIEQVQLVSNCLTTIKEKLDRLEKLEKAMEIIVRKDICPTNLYSAIDYDKYKFAVEYDKIDKEWILTQQEFDLLKEVFENEDK